MNDLPVWLQDWLGWIEHNPEVSLLVLMLAAGVEGLFLIGLIIPGSVLMFSAGVLAAQGYLDPVTTISAAFLGAWVGDLASFALGRHYRHRLPELTGRWALLPRAEAFFARHGNLSVLLGRLIGPLRPFIPAVAGAAGMPSPRYGVVAALACALWALSYALPGMLVGATLLVLADLLGRVSILVGLALVAAYVLYRLVVLLIALSQHYAEPLLLRLIDWSHRHRRLGRLGPALADRQQPETPVLLACWLLLALVMVGLEGLLRWGQAGVNDWNYVVLDTLAGLRSPGTQLLAQWLGGLIDAGLLVAVSVSMSLGFFLSGRLREAAHWLAGLSGSVLLGWVLGQLSPQPVSLLQQSLPLWQWSWGIGLAMLSAGLLVTYRPRSWRLASYWLVGSVVLLSMAGLWLLADSYPDRSLLLAIIVLLWTSLVTLGFRRHARRRRGPAPLWPLVVVVGLSMLLWWQPRPITSPIEPLARLIHQRPDRINLLWTGRPAAALQSAQWQQLPPFSWQALRAWLQSPAPQPLVPALLDGQPPDQTWRYHNQVLRLWRAERWGGSEAQDLWVGQHGLVENVHLLGQMTLPRTRPTQWTDAVWHASALPASASLLAPLSPQLIQLGSSEIQRSLELPQTNTPKP